MKQILMVLTLMVAFSANAQTQLQPHMQSYYQAIEKLQEYIVDKKDYMSEKNDAKIKAALGDFNKKIAALKKETPVKSDDMKFRFSLLSDGLADAENSFNSGSKDYSFWVLKSSLNNCFACHTQHGLSETQYSPSLNRYYDDSTQADFLFLYRNYKKATEIYEKILMGYPTNGLGYEPVENALNKLLYYYVRVQADDNKTSDLLNRILNNDKLPSFVRLNIVGWKKYLNLKKFRLFEVEKIKKVSDLQDFMNTRNNIASQYKLNGQRFLIDLETSKFLYTLLGQKLNPEIKAWVLYWLGFQEKDYRLSMFDQAADNYLQECIQRFPKSSAAPKCLDMYQEIVIDAYTGSRGTDIPSTVQSKLDEYKKLIKK